MTNRTAYFLAIFICAFSLLCCYSCVEKDPGGKDDDPPTPAWKNYPPGWEWEGKHIVWLGTSIPAGYGEKGDYPSYVAEKLGATIHNEAISGSMIRASAYNGTWVNLTWDFSIALSQTQKEKQLIIDHFSSGLDKKGNTVAGGKFGWKDLSIRAPEELTDEAKIHILESSYEHRIIHKYLDSNHPDFIAYADVIVIDHAYNDMNGCFDNSDERIISVPENPLDRGYYIGAVNYLIDEIKKYRPDQRIVLIGHFESEKYPLVHKAQKNLFKYWENVYPSLPLWEKLDWTQEIDPATGKTKLQSNVPDGVHPHSDGRRDPVTGYKLAIKEVGDICVDFLVDLYP